MTRSELRILLGVDDGVLYDWNDPIVESLVEKEMIVVTAGEAKVTEKGFEVIAAAMRAVANWLEIPDFEVSS